MATRPSSMTPGAKGMTFHANACMPAGKLSAVLGLLKARGIDGRSLLMQVGLDPGLLDAPEARIPLQDWIRLNHAAAEGLGDPDFGLHLGEVFQGMPTLLGYLLDACRTLGEALQKYLRYQRLEQEGWTLLALERGEWFELEYRPQRAAARERVMVDFALACIVRHYHHWTGQDLEVQEVQVTYPRPACIREHVRLFGPRVSFGTPRNVLVFPASALAQPLVRANPTVREHLEGPLRRALEALDLQEPCAARVARLLGACPEDGLPPLAQVAVSLGLGTRSLQMKLKEEGTSFQAIRESVRKSLALAALADPGITIQETAFLLGFSEASAFHRAFRRWTGATPAEFRLMAAERSDG